jgi:hypothetical protein
MAVTQTSNKVAAAAESAQTAPTPAAPATVDLELVLYARYYRGSALYEREQAYRFTAEQAEILLAEVEDNTGRPVWKRYKPKPVVQQPNSGIKNVVNAQNFDVKHLADTEQQFTGQRINVGDDSEIADILGAEDGVTV